MRLRSILPFALLLTACGPPDPITWTEVPSVQHHGALLAAWGSADDVWIVGGQPDQGVVLRGSGDVWDELDMPADTPLINWVHGTSSDDVWVAGLSGTLLHWDGNAWSDHSAETEAAFWGIFVRQDNVAVAVGGTSAWGGDVAQARVKQADGTWSEIGLPAPVDEAPNLFKVTWDGSKFWAVGSEGTILHSADGASWTQEPSGYANDLITVASDGQDLVIVGGRGTGVLFEREGDAVVNKTKAPAGLSGVCMIGDGRALVVGEYGYTALYSVATCSCGPFAPTTA